MPYDYNKLIVISHLCLENPNISCTRFNCYGYFELTVKNLTTYFKRPAEITKWAKKQKDNDMKIITNRIDDAYSLMKKVCEQPTNIPEKDECSLYAELLAIKLRSFDANTRGILMHEIDRLIFSAKYQNQIPGQLNYSPQTVQSFGNNESSNSSMFTNNTSIYPTTNVYKEPSNKSSHQTSPLNLYHSQYSPENAYITQTSPTNLQISQSSPTNSYTNTSQ